MDEAHDKAMVSDNLVWLMCYIETWWYIAAVYTISHTNITSGRMSASFWDIYQMPINANLKLTLLNSVLVLMGSTNQWGQFICQMLQCIYQITSICANSICHHHMARAGHMTDFLSLKALFSTHAIAQNWTVFLTYLNRCCF